MLCTCCKSEDHDAWMCPKLWSASELAEHDRTGKCSGWSHGSPYSRKGYDSIGHECPNSARFHVERAEKGNEGTLGDYCGNHVKGYRAYNKNYIRTGEVLGQDRTDFYVITELA